MEEIEFEKTEFKLRVALELGIDGQDLIATYKNYG